MGFIIGLMVDSPHFQALRSESDTSADCSSMAGSQDLLGSKWDPLRCPHMGGCQNYGTFLDPYYNTAPNI